MSNEEGLKIDRIEVLYHQDGFHENEALTLHTVDEGAGSYVVLATGAVGWSFNDFEEVKKVFADFARRTNLLEFMPARESTIVHGLQVDQCSVCEWRNPPSHYAFCPGCGSKFVR
jgi:hypothetical protein